MYMSIIIVVKLRAPNAPRLIRKRDATKIFEIWLKTRTQIIIIIFRNHDNPNNIPVRRRRLMTGMCCHCLSNITAPILCFVLIIPDIMPLYITGVTQCTFHLLVYSELVQKQWFFNSLIIHHSIMITCTSYGNIHVFAILVPECIYIAPL